MRGTCATGVTRSLSSLILSESSVSTRGSIVECLWSHDVSTRSDAGYPSTALTPREGGVETRRVEVSLSAVAALAPARVSLSEVSPCPRICCWAGAAISPMVSGGLLAFSPGSSANVAAQACARSSASPRPRVFVSGSCKSLLANHTGLKARSASVFSSFDAV